MKLAMKMIANGSISGSKSKRWALTTYKDDEWSRAGIARKARAKAGGFVRVWNESLTGRLDLLRAKTTGHSLVL